MKEQGERLTQDREKLDLKKKELDEKEADLVSQYFLLNQFLWFLSYILANEIKLSRATDKGSWNKWRERGNHSQIQAADRKPNLG